MDTAPLIQESRTFVPLRFISEGLGAEVQWESATRTVRITDDGKDKYRIGDFVLYFDENDKVGNNTTHGLLVIDKESGLTIGEGRLENDGMQIRIQIKVDNPTTNITKQREVAEALLKQCISESLVSDIMAYAALKNDLVEKLDRKVFKEGQYEIDVGGGIGTLNIWIYIRYGVVLL